MKMLALKLRSMEKGIIKQEVKDLIVKECKKVLQVMRGLTVTKLPYLTPLFRMSQQMNSYL